MIVSARKLFCLVLFAAMSARAADLQDVALIKGPIPLNDDSPVLQKISVNDASIKTIFQAGAIIRELFKETDIPTDDKDFACIIHVIRWSRRGETRSPDGKALANVKALSKLEVANSNWYVYTTRDAKNATGFAGRRRIFGSQTVYLLIIHLDAPISNGKPYYDLKYQYRTTPRKAANVQDLISAIDIYQSIVGTQREQRAKARGEKANIGNIYAIGQLSGDPPADIALTPAVIAIPNPDGTVKNGDEAADPPQGAQEQMNLEAKETAFDNEGLYWWDVRVGVPITSYKQLDNVKSSGTTVPAEVDRRNILALANWYIKPVDLKNPKVLGFPHLVGGISFASKPLHAALAGIGWGPALANFYIGTLIITNNLPDGKTDTHYKLGFGLNFPVRAIADKLGVKTQIE